MLNERTKEGVKVRERGVEDVDGNRTWVGRKSAGEAGLVRPALEGALPLFFAAVLLPSFGFTDASERLEGQRRWFSERWRRREDGKGEKVIRKTRRNIAAAHP